MKWSLNQAAKEGGVGKATILRAINSGRMSAPKNEMGQYEIDPAEFFRVFPPTNSVPGNEPGTDTDADQPKTAFETGQLAAELKLIRERMTMAGQMHEKELALLNARIEDLRQDRADLRTERDSLLKTLQEQAVSVRLLTDQRPSSPPPPPPADSPPAENGRRSFFAWFRKAG
jgi:hypothetical protein